MMTFEERYPKVRSHFSSIEHPKVPCHKCGVILNVESRPWFNSGSKPNEWMECVSCSKCLLASASYTLDYSDEGKAAAFVKAVEGLKKALDERK